MSVDLDKRRIELYELNSRAWDGDCVLAIAKLDTSLKKNTAFIKKIRISLNNENVGNIIKDISTISLEKYLSEIISAITEGLSKCVKSDDILASMEIVSALHQRFQEKFSPFLLTNFLHGLANPPKSYVKNEKDDLIRVNRQKTLIKLLTEFYLIGIFRTAQDCSKDELPEFVLRKLNKFSSEPILISVLKEILNYDLSSGATIPIVTGFLKRFSPLIYESNSNILTNDMKTKLRAIFRIYTNAIFERTVELHQKLYSLTMKNKKASVRTGRLLEDITLAIEVAEKLFEKFKACSEYLSEVVDMPMPNLISANESTTEDSMITEVVTNKSNEEELGFWESLEVKSFYQPIPDLKTLVSEEMLSVSLSEDSNNLGDKMTDFIKRLEVVSNKQEIDDLVFDYWSQSLNNKASRNRIFKFFIETYEVNKLKFYARFMAINKEYMDNMLQELINYLDEGFRSQIHNNRLNIKNITFFCEFVKFKLVPTHIIFHKIRTLITNITSTNNIDLLGVVFEQIGRFLLQEDEEYRDLMEKMLALLKQKRKNDRLSLNDKMAIDGLLLTVNPPPIKAISSEKSKLMPEQQFIQILIRKELNNKNWERILTFIKKLDLKKPENFNTVKNLFSKAEKINYENLVYLAKMLSLLPKYSKFLMITIIDTVIENFQRGLEINDYRFNRMRIAQIKYIAEMFNYKLINGSVLIEILYKILITGHLNNNPMPNQYCELDSPDNYFRILLVTTLLQSVDKKILGAKQWEKLVLFIQYFDYYLFTKDQPIPKDTEFKLYHMFQFIDPKFVRSNSLKEAVEKLQIIIQNNSSKGAEESDDDEDDDDDDDDDYNGEEYERLRLSNSDTNNSETTENKIHKISKDDTDTEYERKLRDEEEKKFEDDLEKEFQKMVLDSLESRKMEKNTRFNAPVLSKAILAPNQTERTELAKKKEGIPFLLVTKNGKKTTSHQVQLPSDAKVAASVLEEEARQRSQKEKIRNIVLNMED